MARNRRRRSRKQARKCAICDQRVRVGEGMLYGGRLIHIACRGVAKIQRYRLN